MLYGSQHYSAIVLLATMSTISFKTLTWIYIIMCSVLPMIRMTYLVLWKLLLNESFCNEFLFKWRLKLIIQCHSRFRVQNPLSFPLHIILVVLATPIVFPFEILWIRWRSIKSYQAHNSKMFCKLTHVSILERNEFSTMKRFKYKLCSSKYYWWCMHEQGATTKALTPYLSFILFLLP